MNLQEKLQQRLEEKEILLMTHLVLGYPSFETNKAVIAQMADNGVDCIELQIPFTEPIADGPVILKANQESLDRGTTVKQCFAFAKEMAKAHPQVCFLFMTYYNVIFKHGEEQFLQETRDIGFVGTIVPDLPFEEGESYVATSKALGLAPIAFFTPTSLPERMVEVAAQGEGFVYCVARRGVTGKQTEMDSGLETYLSQCRAATRLPLAVGFGISTQKDVAMLLGKADMAVIGTATIKLVDKQGPEAVGPFIASLRSE